MRVTGAAGALLVLVGVRRAQDRLVVAGLAVAALALPIGLTAGSGSGRVVYQSNGAGSLVDPGTTITLRTL